MAGAGQPPVAGVLAQPPLGRVPGRLVWVPGRRQPLLERGARAGLQAVRFLPPPAPPEVWALPPVWRARAWER